jgi:nitroreductase
MELKEAILNRRSIRKFTDYYVTDEEIKEIMEAARWAPSWSNTQAWTFVIIRDKSIIEQISGTFSKINPARQCAGTASALIAACARKGLSGCRGGTELTSLNNWFMFDLGLAVQNLCLRAHDLGLATVIVGFLDHQNCKRILTVPKEQEVVAIIPIGKPDESDRVAPPRKTIDSMTYLNEFGKPFIS